MKTFDTDSATLLDRAAEIITAVGNELPHVTEDPRYKVIATELWEAIDHLVRAAQKLRK